VRHAASSSIHRGQRVGVMSVHLGVGTQDPDICRVHRATPSDAGSVPPLGRQIGPSTEGLITAVLASRRIPNRASHLLGILKLYRGVDADGRSGVAAPLRSAAPARASPLLAKTRQSPRRTARRAVRSRQSARRLLPLRGNPMLAHPTLEQLHALGLHGLAKGFKEPNKIRGARLEHAECRPAARIRTTAPQKASKRAPESPPAPFASVEMSIHSRAARRACSSNSPASGS